MTPAISVAGLTRGYRGQVALDDVTFDVEGESITGLLGRNGAAKPRSWDAGLARALVADFGSPGPWSPAGRTRGRPSATSSPPSARPG